MRKLLSVAAVLGAALAIGIAPAGAITDGELDGNGHPYVGLMVAYADANATQPLWRCSGTLMSSTVFLTAGHCTEAPAQSARVWFDADVQALTCPSGTLPPASCYPFGGGDSHTGDVFGHPQYNPNAFFLFDLGVVVLDAPVTKPTYGELPTLNQLDALKPNRSTTFDAVGYGLQKSFPIAAAWKNVAQRVRMIAHPHLVQINTGFVGDFSLLLSNNTNTGGTCFGDSGGPNFLAGTNVVAGVTSYGLNRPCGGTGGVYRVDRADDLTWLATFGLTP